MTSIDKAIEVLEACDEYFGNKIDPDFGGDPGEYIPTTESNLLSDIQDALIGLNKFKSQLPTGSTNKQGLLIPISKE